MSSKNFYIFAFKVFYTDYIVFLYQGTNNNNEIK